MQKTASKITHIPNEFIVFPFMKKMYKKMYFMGIKGVGMASLAIIAKQAGIDVAGSDVSTHFITDETLEAEGIHVLAGFDPQNVSNFLGKEDASGVLFVATGAHNGFDNVEAKFAKEKGINVISHGQAVGLFMEGKVFDREWSGISVSGAHGKTTISGMIAVALSALRFDPSYTIGTSSIFPIGASGHYGKGDYFIAEADEYLSESNYDRTPKFLYQKPKYLIINNIDFDHPDFYPSIDDIYEAFSKLVAGLDSGAIVIGNGDDERVKKLLDELPITIRKVTYGIAKDNEIVLDKFHQERDSVRFDVLNLGTLLGEVRLKVPGFHNAKNSLGVIALLIELGVSFEQIKDALFAFEGTKRRIENVGETKNGIKIIDDYAHHPEEIKKTLASLKTLYPEKKIIVIFQPHTFSRTKTLLPDFISSFGDANSLLLLPTFASMRGDDGQGSEDLLEGLRRINKPALVFENINNVVEYVGQNFHDTNTLIVTMGAGDVYKVGEKLAIKEKN